MQLASATHMKKRPYWLRGGMESCQGCTHTYVREMEYRCAGCDRGFCEHCVVVVRETHEWLCTECDGAAEEDA